MLGVGGQLDVVDARIERALEDKFIDITVGTCYGDSDVRRAMHIADERMYVDKNFFYAEHPELKYR